MKDEEKGSEVLSIIQMMNFISEIIPRQKDG